jgi:hypothetical protein
MKTKIVHTLAIAPDGSTVSEVTHNGRKHSREQLWKAAEALESAGHTHGEVRQTEEGAKAWAVYAWKAGCKTMPTLVGIPKKTA